MPIKTFQQFYIFAKDKEEKDLGGNPQIFLLKQLSKTQHFIQLKYIKISMLNTNVSGCLSSRRRNPH